ncbi:MAG TPA: aldo/keto reductase [Phototrophicaceae bacterium]|nr:aldo/keto reductase [Phototrophicaceae bacterium]
MNYRRLGKSGLKVSELSFGAWVTFGTQLDVDHALACMTAAYDAGCNFFDNAEAYAAGDAEIVMGEALQRAGWSRDSFVVSSKVMFGSQKGEPKPNQWGLSRKHIYEACYDAMDRLQVDYLDLYFCHRPDPEVPIEETVRIMTELIQRGDILYWGTSEWSAQQIMEAYSVARQYGLIPPTMEQPQYNIMHRTRVEQEYARLYDVVGLGTTIFSPLAAGFLTTKYLNGIPADSRANLPGYEWLKAQLDGEKGKARIAAIKKLNRIAEDIGTTLPRMALAWCLKNPNVSTVITGASKPEQVVENMKAIEVVPLLTDDVLQQIDAVTVDDIGID